MTNQQQEKLPQFTLCRDTGALAVGGTCPIHGGDACLFDFIRLVDSRARLSAAETERRSLSIEVALSFGWGAWNHEAVLETLRDPERAARCFDLAALASLERKRYAAAKDTT